MYRSKIILAVALLACAITPATRAQTVVAATAEGPLEAAVGASQEGRSPEDSILGLAGRWAGMGSYQPARGPAQPFKCVVTYFPASDGSTLKQNLRCHNDNYRIDARTRLEINGRQVTGEWEDRLNALSGSLYGLVTDGGFDVRLEGRFFQAKMIVVSSRCEQSVTVTPARADRVREVQASLRKC